MSLSCLTCGAHHADDAKFCRACGSALSVAASAASPAPSPSCPACGQPIRPGSRFCSQCGAALPAPQEAAAPRVMPPPSIEVVRAAARNSTEAAAAAAAVPRPGTATRRPPLLWPALGGSAVVLAAFMLWWYGAMRVPASPSFDAAPPPAALDMAGPASAVAAMPRAASAGRFDTAGADGMITETRDDEARRPAPVARATPEAPRESAASAPDPAPAPRRSPPPARSAPRAPAAAASFRTAAERCADRNLLSRSICQSRECARAEHAKEPMCQRIRAAEDKRREQ